LDKKRKIGIIYNVTDDWIGGKYYLDSIVAVLKRNDSLFDLYIFSADHHKGSNDGRFYRYKLNIIERILQKLGGKLSLLTDIYLKVFRSKTIKKLMSFDSFFPVINDIIFAKLPDFKKMYWIPDFQENHYPDFFKKWEIIQRIALQVNVAYSDAKLILSSIIARNDFMRLYPQACCNIVIIQFISSLYFQEYDIPDYGKLQKKYCISDGYFVCSNQFWAHKNHIVIVNALLFLKASCSNIKVFFTGKEYDYRDPEYIFKLKEMVKILKLENNIIFLGFISRIEQIALIKYAKAVIQPSLSEGWNTTIEDAKFLGKEVIASDIDVHREQLNEKGYFFSPNDAESLAGILRSLINTSSKTIDYSYQTCCIEYQKKIVHLFS
jgi:glycosyltransferase involved in cell wall biosynthesis